jgi:TolA-binding protein
LNIGGLALLAVIVIGVLMARSKKAAEVAAAGKLGIAEVYLAVEEFSTAMGELSEVIDTYPGTRSTGRAVFLLANAYFTTNDYIKAEQYFQMYIDDYADDEMFTASGLAGVAACKESQGQYGEAARLYEEAARNHADNYTAPFFLKDAGRCYVQAGQIDKGKEMYSTILDEYTESSMKQEVEFLLKAL